MTLRSRAPFVAAAAAVGIAALTGCGGTSSSSRVEGSGVSKTVSRSVPAFSKVELAGIGTARVHPGSPQAVTITGDDNIVPLVTTEVRDGTLVVSTKENTQLSTVTPLVVEVRAPSVTGSSLTGSGDLSVDGVAGPRFDAALTGTGKLDVGGTVSALDATVSGTGAAQLEHLVAEDAHVVMSGVGDAHVFVTHSLDASVTGMGSIVYGGNPQHVQSKVTGLGEVAAE